MVITPRASESGHVGSADRFEKQKKHASARRSVAGGDHLPAICVQIHRRTRVHSQLRINRGAGGGPVGILINVAGSVLGPDEDSSRSPIVFSFNFTCYSQPLPPPLPPQHGISTRRCVSRPFIDRSSDDRASRVPPGHYDQEPPGIRASHGAPRIGALPSRRGRYVVQDDDLVYLRHAFSQRRCVDLALGSYSRCHTPFRIGSTIPGVDVFATGATSLPRFTARNTDTSTSVGFFNSFHALCDLLPARPCSYHPHRPLL